jgi:hypothetical protein
VSSGAETFCPVMHMLKKRGQGLIPLLKKKMLEKKKKNVVVYGESLDSRYLQNVSRLHLVTGRMCAVKQENTALKRRLYIDQRKWIHLKKDKSCCSCYQDNITETMV